MTDSLADWSKRAHEVLPAGGFGNYDPNFIVKRGEGSRVWDSNGKQYIDLLIGSGPMILGHTNAEVMEVIEKQLRDGLTFFANNEKGIELAEQICRAVPCAEQLRYLSSGGEADMYAMRLARAHTGKNKIVKFEGGYHGMSAEAQMSLMPTEQLAFPQAQPDSAGIPASVSQEVLVAPYNNIDYFRQLLDEYEGQVAGIIIEPLQRIVPPKDGYLQAVRDECDKRGIVLIFDEVVTGFRFSYGGAQELYGVKPDLCTLGKIIGGGLPMAAVAGKQDIMAHFDKDQVGSDKWLMQIGTLSGNPLAAVAGLKTLEILNRPDQYARLRNIGSQLQSRASSALKAHNIDHQIVGEPTLFEVVFSKQSISDYRDTQSANKSLADKFNKGLRENGVFKSPAKTYASLALTKADIEQVSTAYQGAASSLIS